MAMSESERRTLRDIERRLAADSPRLDRRLCAFNRVCRDAPVRPGHRPVTCGRFGRVQRRVLRAGVAAVAALLVIAALLPSGRGSTLRSVVPAHSSAPAHCPPSCSPSRRGPVAASGRLDPARRVS